MQNIVVLCDTEVMVSNIDRFCISKNMRNKKISKEH